jgi:peptidoglycan/LPS O-acetylase OafA/YrhL
MVRIKELDGLRAIAAVIVILWHYVGIPDGPEHWLWNVFYLGHFGVDLFFILSGFLITTLLLENREASCYFSSFYGRRAFRIWPIYYLMVLLCGIGWLSGKSPALFDGAVPGWTYLFGVQNIWMARLQSYGAYWLAGTWSLAIEEQFYLLFPLLVRFIPAAILPKILVAIIIICPLGRLLDSFTPDEFGYYVLPQFRADSLAIGALIAWWRLRASVDSDQRNDVDRIVKLALVVSAAMLPLICLAGTKTFHAAAWQHTLAGVFFGSAVFVVLQIQGAWYLAPLRSRVARHLANWSYCSYMIHHWVAFLIFQELRVNRTMMTATGASTTALALVATFGLCALSYRFFERPLLQSAHERFQFGRARPASVLRPAE